MVARLLLLALCAFWFCFFGSHAWTDVLRYCAPHYDFGIYVQAIAQFSWHDLNPWLSARGLRIFNDHFDPVLYLAVPLRTWLTPSVAALLIEQTLVLASLLPVVWLWRVGTLNASGAWILCAFLLLSIGTINAVQFPIHPTSWAILPAALLGVAWVQRRNGLLLLAVVLLCACKEEHALCGPFIAIGLWRRGELRTAWAVAGLTCAWAAFVFFLRPLLWGPTFPYLQETLAALFHRPAQTLSSSLHTLQLRRLGTLLLPFAPMAYWAVRGGYRPAWPLLLATLPLLASRFLWGRWIGQYGSPLTGMWVASCIPLLAHRTIPRWVSATTLLLLVGAAEHPLRDTLNRWRSGQEEVCSNNPERIKALKDGIAYLLAHQEGAAIVAGGLVAPLAQRPEVYALASSARISRFPYRYLLVEKPFEREQWPMNEHQVSKLVDKYLQRPTTHILRENQYVLLAEGDFHPSGFELCHSQDDPQPCIPPDHIHGRW